MEKRLLTAEDWQYIKAVAAEIGKALTYKGMNVYLSWGVHEVKAVNAPNAENDLRPALEFKVNGYMYQGAVRVAYDRGEDLYDLELIDNMETYKGVYCDELAQLVDDKVETGGNWDEYVRQVENDEANKPFLKMKKPLKVIYVV